MSDDQRSCTSPIAIPGTPADQVRARTVITLLYLSYLLSFADRTIFGMSLKPIKATLGFSDSQLGVLAGAAFAVSYALFSPVGGWIVDRYVRKGVMAGAVAFFSLATLFTGMAGSFVTMALARVSVGVGESLISPLSASLIGDVVPRERRARVFSVYLSAGALGSIVALGLGGLVVHALLQTGPVVIPILGSFQPWQGLFACAAGFGFILALAILLLLREPPRLPQVAPELDKYGFEDIGAFVRRYRALIVAIFLGMSLFTLPGYTFSTWSIVFYERVHGWTPVRTALLTACTSGVFVLIGCLTAGRFIEYLKRRGVVDAPLRVGIGAATLFCIFGTTAMFVQDAYVTLALMSCALFMGYVPPVCIYASIGDLIPSTARGRFAALHTLTIGIVANAVGPLLVGVFNDRLFAGAEANIRYSLSTLFVIATITGIAVTLPGLRLYRQRCAELS